jgi:HK97 gp10 family phage protein
MRVKTRIDGLKELNAGLAQLKKSTQAGVLTRVLKKAAKPIADKAKDLAPVETGELKNSIGLTVVRSTAGKSAYAAAMKAGASRSDAAQAARDANRADAGQSAKANVLVGTPLWRAHFAEFGTRKTPAHPFLGPALRSQEKMTIGIIKETLVKEIEATARRVARKKAKKK